MAKAKAQGKAQERATAQAASQKQDKAAAQLEARLRQALAERDQALTQLAAARADLEALRRAAAVAGEPPVPAYPPSAGLGPPPLRYVVVDAANDQLKALLGPVHGGLSALMRLVVPKER